MISETRQLLDDVGSRLVCELQRDARLSYAELGRRVGLSTPSVKERVLRLEEAGIITGYHARVDAAKMGLPITAIVRIQVPGSGAQRVARGLAETPEVCDCYHVTGEDCYVCLVRVPSVGDMEDLIERLSRYGSTTTSIVLSSPMNGRMIEPRPTVSSER